MAAMTTSDLFSSPSPTSPEREIISVSQLNRRARQLLETHIPLLWVEGELSNVSIPSSGHWYFTLKDDQEQVRCAMFRNRNMLVRFKPQQGQHVLIRARVSLYEGRGDYQIIVEHMEEAGTGALQRAFEELKNKLALEGLFDPTHKKALPSLPRHIAVITSPTGAAIRDILSVLERRFAGIPSLLFLLQCKAKRPHYKSCALSNWQIALSYLMWLYWRAAAAHWKISGHLTKKLWRVPSLTVLCQLSAALATKWISLSPILWQICAHLPLQLLQN
jgi:exodeoxyribonuclease VII large subunit